MPTALLSPSPSSVPSPPIDNPLNVDDNTNNTEIVAETPDRCEQDECQRKITTKPLPELRQIVEHAVKERKTFTIKGNWPAIRRELYKRDWVEKIEWKDRSKTNINNNNDHTNDDLLDDLPVKQDWETQNDYIEKCERTIMSRMLRNCDIDFHWQFTKDYTYYVQRLNPDKLLNMFNRSLFASKEGLALLLQQAYWYTEQGVSSVNFPRCYVLGFPDHFNMFVDDFRRTACTSLLMWLIEHYENGSQIIASNNGDVPISCLQFALQRCQEYLEFKKHLDIDKNYDRIWDHEWEQFLSNYYKICHGNSKFLQQIVDNNNQSTIANIYKRSKNILVELQIYCPEIRSDGTRNIWILKPGNKCRGRGIRLIKDIQSVERTMNPKLKYVVQKYIEKPLLIYQTKFDIRQWFIVSNTQPLVIWMYRECYLRFSSQTFSLSNFHESLHLTNYAIQHKYKNQQDRNNLLPDDNMWDLNTFKSYLQQLGYPNKWNDSIYPGMRESIICAMLSSQDVMDRRRNTYELYGADFMVTADFQPWLIEINCTPDLSPSTSVTKRLCPMCLQDLIKVIIDKRRNPQADTGLFDCIYRQNLPKAPPYSNANLAIRGRKVYRYKSKIVNNENKQINNNQQPQQQKSQKQKQQQQQQQQKQQQKQQQPKQQHQQQKQQQQLQIKRPQSRKDLIKLNQKKTKLPEIKSPTNYRVPVIEDLIKSIQKPPENNKKKTTTSQITKTMNKTQSAPPVARVETNKKSDINNNNKHPLQVFYSDNTENLIWSQKTVNILKGKNIFNKQTVMNPTKKPRNQ